MVLSLSLGPPPWRDVEQLSHLWCWRLRGGGGRHIWPQCCHCLPPSRHSGLRGLSRAPYSPGGPDVRTWERPACPAAPPWAHAEDLGPWVLLTCPCCPGTAWAGQQLGRKRHRHAPPRTGGPPGGTWKGASMPPWEPPGLKCSVPPESSVLGGKCCQLNWSVAVIPGAPGGWKPTWPASAVGVTVADRQSPSSQPSQGAACCYSHLDELPALSPCLFHD